jgi:uncharacterized SAM-binding protein YcdF (DUF218 family)
VKFLRLLLVASAVFALIVWAIGSYLAPDDIAKCGARPDPSKEGCLPADAIVAVSGGDTGARADEAIKLHQNGWAPILIFSGAAADTSGPSNAEVMKQRAIDAGVDANSIIIETTSQNTTQNAEATTTIFKQRGIKAAIIVTSAYHERRASLEFQKRTSLVSVRSHPVMHDKQWGPLWWLTPTGWFLAIPELVASLILSTGGQLR